MLLLAIDTSTNMLSLALMEGEAIICEHNEVTKNNQSAILMTRIEEMLIQKGYKAKDISKIAVATGPGSYTGIRVGVTAAKSLGYGLKVPVIGVSSLEIMAHAAAHEGEILALVDARRGTVFAGGYEKGTTVIPDSHYNLVELITKTSSAPSLIISDKSDVHKEIIDTYLPKVTLINETELSSKKATALAHLAKNREGVANIHQLIPNYLRKTEAEVNAGV